MRHSLEPLKGHLTNLRHLLQQAVEGLLVEQNSVHKLLAGAALGPLLLVEKQYQQLGEQALWHSIRFNNEPSSCPCHRPWRPWPWRPCSSTRSWPGDGTTDAQQTHSRRAAWKCGEQAFCTTGSLSHHPTGQAALATIIHANTLSYHGYGEANTRTTEH